MNRSGLARAPKRAQTRRSTSDDTAATTAQWIIRLRGENNQACSPVGDSAQRRSFSPHRGARPQSAQDSVHASLDLVQEEGEPFYARVLGSTVLSVSSTLDDWFTVGCTRQSVGSTLTYNFRRRRPKRAGDLSLLSLGDEAPWLVLRAAFRLGFPNLARTFANSERFCRSCPV